ncbi:MAG: hypothetical protein ABIH83_00240 [Candidatus Micrarchaeota archaeon]
MQEQLVVSRKNEEEAIARSEVIVLNKNDKMDIWGIKLAYNCIEGGEETCVNCRLLEKKRNSVVKREDKLYLGKPGLYMLPDGCSACVLVEEINNEGSFARIKVDICAPE